MARYCTQCGRKLEDGEVCNCTQQSQNNTASGQNVQPQNNTASGQNGQPQNSTASGQNGQPQNHIAAGSNVHPQNYSQQNTYADYQNRQGQGTNYQQGPGMNYRQGQGTNYQQGPGMNYQQGRGFNNGQMKQMGAQAMAGAQNMFREIIPILKKPVSETRRIARSNSPAIGLELIGLKALIILIIVLIAGSRISSAANGMVQIPYLKIIVITLLMTMGVDALEALLLKGFAGMFKGTTDINAMFCVVGTRALYDAIIAVAMGLLVLISIQAAVFVFAAGSIILPYVQYGAYRAVVPGDEDIRVYAYFLAKLVSAVVMYFIFYMVAESIASTLLGNVFNSLSGLGI